MQKHQGSARFRADGLEVDDYFTFPNAISPDPDSVPAKVSFDVRWQGGGDEQSIDDSTFGFRGVFVTGPATISFKARAEHSDVEYRSDNDDQTNVGDPGVGREQNGVFY